MRSIIGRENFLWKRPNFVLSNLRQLGLKSLKKKAIGGKSNSEPHLRHEGHPGLHHHRHRRRGNLLKRRPFVDTGCNRCNLKNRQKK